MTTLTVDYKEYPWEITSIEYCIKTKIWYARVSIIYKGSGNTLEKALVFAAMEAHDKLLERYISGIPLPDLPGIPHKEVMDVLLNNHMKLKEKEQL